jgi:hypothetical protein
LEKARYLYELKESLFADKNITQAAKEIAKMGSKTDYVKHVLVGFEVYLKIEDDKFYQLRDLNDTTFYFNYIVALLTD